jgi:hypothetical protein
LAKTLPDMKQHKDKSAYGGKYGDKKEKVIKQDKVRMILYLKIDFDFWKYITVQAG